MEFRRDLIDDFGYIPNIGRISCSVVIHLCLFVALRRVDQDIDSAFLVFVYFTIQDRNSEYYATGWISILSYSFFAW